MPNYSRRLPPYHELCGALEPEEYENDYGNVDDVPQCYYEDWLLDHEEDVKRHFEEEIVEYANERAENDREAAAEDAAERAADF